MSGCQIVKKRRRTEMFPFGAVEEAERAGRTIVFTDGSASRDQSGAGVWFGDDNPRNVSKRVSGSQDSARAELFAIVCALEQSAPAEKLTILSDSQDALRSVRSKSTRLIQRCPDLLDRLTQLEPDRDVQYVWTPGHSGIRGNEAADKLAKRARVDVEPIIPPRKVKATKPKKVQAKKPKKIKPQANLWNFEQLCGGDPIAREVLLQFQQAERVVDYSNISLAL